MCYLINTNWKCMKLNGVHYLLSSLFCEAYESDHKTSMSPLSMPYRLQTETWLWPLENAFSEMSWST